MRRTCALVVILLAAVLLVAAALPAEAFHWHYFHPVWGWGGWPHLVGPFYPPVAYVAPPFVIQPQLPPQIYIQRPQEPPSQPAVWYWCQNPQGFWPHIQKCENDAWMKVLPSTAPPQQR